MNRFAAALLAATAVLGQAVEEYEEVRLMWDIDVHTEDLEQVWELTSEKLGMKFETAIPVGCHYERREEDRRLAEEAPQGRRLGIGPTEGEPYRMECLVTVPKGEAAVVKADAEKVVTDIYETETFTELATKVGPVETFIECPYVTLYVGKMTVTQGSQLSEQEVRVAINEAVQQVVTDKVGFEADTNCFFAPLSEMEPRRLEEGRRLGGVDPEPDDDDDDVERHTRMTCVVEGLEQDSAELVDKEFPSKAHMMEHLNEKLDADGVPVSVSFDPEDEYVWMAKYCGAPESNAAESDWRLYETHSAKAKASVGVLGGRPGGHDGRCAG